MLKAQDHDAEKTQMRGLPVHVYCETRDHLHQLGHVHLRRHVQGARSVSVDSGHNDSLPKERTHEGGAMRSPIKR